MQFDGNGKTVKGLKDEINLTFRGAIRCVDIICAPKSMHHFSKHCANSISVSCQSKITWYHSLILLQILVLIL